MIKRITRKTRNLGFGWTNGPGKTVTVITGGYTVRTFLETYNEAAKLCAGTDWVWEFRVGDHVVGGDRSTLISDLRWLNEGQAHYVDVEIVNNAEAD